MEGVCEGVADVSAESCQVQTVLVGLRSHRKRRVLDRLPQSADAIDLTKNLSLVKAKFHYGSITVSDSKLVADRFEAGSRQVADRFEVWSATSFEPIYNDQLRSCLRNQIA